MPNKFVVFCLIILFSFSLTEVAKSSDEVKAFVYHRFGDTRYPLTNISLDNFKQHLEILQQENFVVLTLGEVVDRFLSQKDLPTRCAVLTVDDATRTFLTGAIPLLQEFGYPATLFVSTDTIGGNDYLDWQQLRGLLSKGIEIGNHSSSHAYLLDLRENESIESWRHRVAIDIQNAQGIFKRYLGYEPKLFAYPFGEYSLEMVEIVKQIGFKAAFAQQSGVIARGNDLYSLPRFPMSGISTEPSEFREKLLMHHLPIEVIEPKDTIIQHENPPRLRVRIDTNQIAVETLRCFVPGQNSPSVYQNPENQSEFVVRALQPLQGRRSKYTLTAQGKKGSQWFWFSQLWVLPEF